MSSATILDVPLRFANFDEGRAIIATSDFYTQNLTDFDRRAKTRRLDHVNEADYLCNCARFVRAWSIAERNYLSELARHADLRLRELELNIKLPDEIVLIKTTGEEEGGANGYTRRNAIYLNQGSLSPNLFVHELFHIISRYNETRIREVYALLGFKPCNLITYDDPLRITNPDAPYLRYYLTVQITDGPVDVVMIMRASRPYSGGSFFKYYQKMLLVVEGEDDAKKVALRNGRPWLLGHSDPFNLYAYIGRSTDYNIHQEEISAVHFEMLMLGIPRWVDQKPIHNLADALR
ncbi:hypothetical protein [Roseibium album]|uniref:hypothetical protein n=1 Tax=Roseibium album TaxID=311410 RepID=UPI003297C6D0